MEKMTYAKALEVAIAEVKDIEVVEKLTALKASLARKSSGERKPSPTQLANEKLKVAILDFMDEGTAYTVSEIQKGCTELPEDISNQRVSALVRQLKDSGAVTRSEVKGKAYFSKN